MQAQPWVALMANGLVVGDDARVAAWTYAAFKLFPVPVIKALGVVNEDGFLVGGILFQNYNGVNVNLSYYGPGTVSGGIVRAISRICISELHVARLTIIVPKKNKRLLRSVQRFGFRLEGVQRRFYGHRDCARNTGVRFVMFSEHLNKLAGYKDVPSVQQQA